MNENISQNSSDKGASSGSNATAKKSIISRTSKGSKIPKKNTFEVDPCSAIKVKAFTDW